MAIDHMTEAMVGLFTIATQQIKKDRLVLFLYFPP